MARPFRAEAWRPALGVIITSDNAMSTEEIENAALNLTPRERARLAERLLESLEDLTDDENERLWAEEAARRGAAWDSHEARPASDVLHDARSRLSRLK